MSLGTTNVESIAITKQRWEVTEVLRWNHFSIKSNVSNFKCIYFNRDIMLDMQDVQETTQRRDIIFNSLGLGASISLVLEIFLSLIHI